MRHRIFIICLSIFTAVSATAGWADEHPHRIISLGSFLTEGLFSLGAGEEIVGVTTYCNRPPKAKAKEKAGSIVEVNLEKVIALKPDLVLTTPLTNVKAKDKLRKLGIRVVDFQQVRDFTQICQQFLKLGRLVDKEQEAKVIIRQAQSKVESIQKSIAKEPLQRVFIQVGTKPLFTMNKEFFLNDLIKRAGGINIAEDTLTGIYSREKVVEANPDVIIIAAMGLAAEDEKVFWMRHKTINAVKQNKIYSMDPNMICNPIPDNFAQTLEIVAGFLHKDNGATNHVQ